MYNKLMCFSLVVISVMGNPDQSDEGKTKVEQINSYKILKFNPLSASKSDQEDEENILLLGNNGINPGLPIFLLEPKDTYVLRGKPANLLCRVANASLAYFKCNDIEVENTRCQNVNSQNNIRVIEAELEVTKNDLKEYFGNKYFCECWAWNSEGSIRSQLVFVELSYIKKQFQLQPQSVIAEVGNNVTFHCSPPLAVPPATIEWVRNGQTLQTKEKSFVVPQVSAQDSANYTCIAKNLAGRRKSRVAVLTVNGPWSVWGEWSSCDENCLIVRRRKCTGNCFGSNYQQAPCDVGNCFKGRFYIKKNTVMYVGIGTTVILLTASTALLCGWLRSFRPGYTAPDPETTSIFFRDEIDKLSRPDNDRLMPDRKYSRTCQQFSGGNHYEMTLVNPSQDSSSCINPNYITTRHDTML